MTKLTLETLHEIKEAAETPTGCAESERLRGFVGTLLDELSVLSGIVGHWAQREIDKESCFGNASRLDELRKTRSYAENLVHHIHSRVALGSGARR